MAQGQIAIFGKHELSPFRRSIALWRRSRTIGWQYVGVSIGVRRQIGVGSQHDWIQAALSSSRADFEFQSLAVGRRLTGAARRPVVAELVTIDVAHR